MYKMRKRYNFISIVNLNKATLLALLIILPSLLMAQQSPSIQTGVTFQWADTQPTLNSPATIQSVTIDGTVYNTFVVPTSYELTRLGPDGHTTNSLIRNGTFVGGNSGQANWEANAISAFQDKNLNHYFTANQNGRDICIDFDAAATTDAQKQTIFYNPSIPSNEGGVLAVTERGGNNCFYIEAFGIPVGGGAEQKLGETFVRNVGDYRGCLFTPPVVGSDYWQSGRCNENGQTIGIGLFYLNDLAPTGSRITKIEFIAASRDHGDGKFFMLQKYAVDQENLNCIDTEFNGDLNVSNNVPDNSTYSLVSGPTPAGQSFNLNSNGTYSYVPDPGFTGDVNFDYEVCLPRPNTSVCDTATATINYVPLPDTLEIDISCGANGSFTISVTNPLGDEYEYAIDNGAFQTSPDFNDLPEGQYSIKVRNRFTTCENDYPNPIILDSLELTGTVTNVLCNSDNTGAINITASGGASPYTYAWNTGETSQDLSDIASGTYTVTVTDANGCTITGDYSVTQPAEELSATLLASNITCNGESTGAINLTASGGTAPYTYLWTNGATTEDIDNIAAGSYSVTVTDTNECEITEQITVEEPTIPLSATANDITNVDCNGSETGSITVEATGGTSPYQFSLDNGVTTQTNNIFENLAAGTYTITIIDNNLCSTTVNAIVTQPTELEITTVTANDVDCSGEATGAINIDVVGGTAPYSYAWSNSTTNQNLTDVFAGSYSVTVTDANGCTVIGSETITEPANPISINISKIDANTAQGCTNGEATADVSGGTAPYTYQWSASANNQITATATNLPVGSHTVTVTDANDCELIQSVVIVCVNTCDGEIAIQNITNVLCVGDATGSGTVSASSNANPDATFTFTWSNGQVDTGVTSSTLANVTAGVYDVSVTIDGTVCQPVEETISITEPNNALNLTATSTDELGPNTDDGTASAVATGGVEPYTFVWSPDGETTQDISGLAAGDYSVTVTDANGCTETVTITVNPGTCNDLSISGTSTSVICNGESNGSVTSVVANGVGPFTYGWDTLPDTTASVSDLPAGSYTVTVTDQTTLCTQTTTITVNEPNALSTGIAVTNILCKGDSTGSVDLTVNGGTAPYSFLWNTGDTTEDLTDVVAGTYAVTVTDANGCTATNQSEVLEPADAVSATITQITNVGCLGENTGSITAEGAGGIPPYTYSIDNGATSQANGLFENLIAGNYTILITDANGCTITISGTIETDDIEDPEITVPSAIIIEGCSVTDITTANAVFVYSDIESDNVQIIFESNPDYNATDDFNIVSITYIDVITSVDNCPITVLRTFTITDNCGNTATVTQTITVQDTTAPTFTVPDDITIECDVDVDDLTLTGNVTDEADNCDTGLDATYADAIAAGDCANESVITRTWSLTDGCDNTTTRVQTINVVDTTAPTLVTPFDENVTAACDDVPEVPNLVFQDSCSTNISVVFNENSTQLNDFEDYDIIRTWTVTDECGNQDIFTQTIMIEVSNVIDAFDSRSCVLDPEFDLFNLLSGDFNMNGIWSVVSGNATINGSLFDPSTVEVGVYTFMYTITEGPCPTEVEVNVTIDDDCVVLACGEDDVIISKTVTANGDNYNEFFTIGGVDDCGFVIELQIFNRWGAKIYENNNYQNNWNGDSHNSSVGSSGKVPTGTYYYIINLRNSGLKPFAGPIYVATNK